MAMKACTNKDGGVEKIFADAMCGVLQYGLGAAVEAHDYTVLVGKWRLTMYLEVSMSGPMHACCVKCVHVQLVRCVPVSSVGVAYLLKWILAALVYHVTLLNLLVCLCIHVSCGNG